MSSNRLNTKNIIKDTYPDTKSIIEDACSGAKSITEDTYSGVKSILLITAHADDHVMCAGTVLKLRDQGYRVNELILTSSNEGRDFRNPEGDYDVESMREGEFVEASKFLGVHQTFRLGEDDLDLAYSKNLVFKVVEVVRQVKPEIGIIMPEFDWHPDHVEAYKIGSTAFKLAATGIQPKLGDHHRTPIILMMEGMLPVKPNVLVDITEYQDQKVELFKIYKSQASDREILFQQSLDRVRGYHVRRLESTFAEAFTTDPTSPTLFFE